MCWAKWLLMLSKDCCHFSRSLALEGPLISVHCAFIYTIQFVGRGGSSGGDLAPSLGGRKIFRGRRFLKKISIFTAKISYDLFLVIDQVFRIFSFFYQIFRIFPMFIVVYHPFLIRKHCFLLFSYFPTHPTTLLLKILGGADAWAVPTSNFGGTVPPVP